MAEALVLKAVKRQDIGTRYARKERKQGQVPAIIYGHKKEPIPVLLSYHDLTLELQHHHRLVEVELEGQREKYLVKAVQFDYLGDTIIHVDLTRVSLDERVRITVAVELKGIPAGISEGGILEHIITDVELECLVTSIPEVIKASVAHLNVNDTLLASELELPDGATLVTKPDARVAVVRESAKMASLAEEVLIEEEGGSAEPEVIAREKAEGAEEEKK